jgi:DNA-binding PadR family transcriptional regulator
MSAKLSAISWVVLGLVERMGPSTSYALSKEVERSVGALWRFPRSQIYAEPRRLVQTGHLLMNEEVGGRRRQTFSITMLGRQALATWLTAPTDAPAELRDEGVLKLSFAAMGTRDGLAELARDRAQHHDARVDRLAAAAGELAAEGASSRAASLRLGVRLERAMAAYWRELAAAPSTIVQG